MKSTRSKQTNKQTNQLYEWVQILSAITWHSEQKGTSAISKGKARMNKPADLLSLSYRPCMKGNDITAVKKIIKNNAEQVFEVATLIYYKAMKMNVSKKRHQIFFFLKRKKTKKQFLSL